MSQLPPQGAAPHWIPPTAPQPLAPRPSAWPTVFGVIMIVAGSVAALHGCFGAFSPLFGQVIEKFVKSFAPNQPSGMEVMQQWMPWLIANGVIAMMLGILCLTAGIGLLKRRASGARRAMWWVAAKLAYIIPCTIFQVFFQLDNIDFMKEQVAAQSASSGPMPVGFMNSIMSIGLVVGAIVNVLWLLVLPVTLLIWLRRGVIRREVAEWK